MTQVLAECDDMRLMRYDSGERRIEDARRGVCSVWMTQEESDSIVLHPEAMRDWALDDDIGVYAAPEA